jgi:hypothetical protein
VRSSVFERENERKKRMNKFTFKNLTGETVDLWLVNDLDVDFEKEEDNKITI